MWNYDPTLDIYRHSQHPKYYLEIEANKAFPGWKTYYLADQQDDYSWKMVATDLQAALDEAANLVERLVSRGSAV